MAVRSCILLSLCVMVAVASAQYPNYSGPISQPGFPGFQQPGQGPNNGNTDQNKIVITSGSTVSQDGWIITNNNGRLTIRPENPSLCPGLNSQQQPGFMPPGYQGNQFPNFPGPHQPNGNGNGNPGCYIRCQNNNQCIRSCGNGNCFGSTCYSNNNGKWEQYPRRMSN